MILQLPCPLCGKPTVSVFGATVRLDEQGHLALRCVDCWRKVKKEVN